MTYIQQSFKYQTLSLTHIIFCFTSQEAGMTARTCCWAPSMRIHRFTQRNGRLRRRPPPPPPHPCKSAPPPPVCRPCMQLHPHTMDFTESLISDCTFQCNAMKRLGIYARGGGRGQWLYASDSSRRLLQGEEGGEAGGGGEGRMD